MEVRWQVEIDPFCRRVLEKHWPTVTRYKDVKHVGAHNLEPVDLICGGFPCQDISFAGSGDGITGERSSLWGDFHRIVCELRPQYVLVENVAALLHRGLRTILRDLANVGYDAEWSLLSACAVGAPHMRQRLFVVAHANCKHGWSWVWDSTSQEDGSIPTGRSPESAAISWSPLLEDPSALYGGADGVPDRMDRNRAIGNAVVPQVAEWIGRRIMAVEEGVKP